MITYIYICTVKKKTGFRSYQILSFGTHSCFCFANVPDMSIAWTMVKMASAQVPGILSPSSPELLRSVQKQTIYISLSHLFVGKLQYFTNLNSSAIWEWCPLLTMIPVRSRWGRYNLPIYIYIYMCVAISPFRTILSMNCFLSILYILHMAYYLAILCHIIFIMAIFELLNDNWSN